MEAALWAYFLIGPVGALLLGALVATWVVRERRR